MTQAPFEGLRVLDFTHILAGPFCAYQLGVMGADVIKIESPDKPDFVREEGVSAALSAQGRGSHFISQNGNKRSLCLDLRAEGGRRVARRLIETADVLVENYRRGAMERHGLGYEQARESNPNIIYCSLTGFGHSGEKGPHPAYDFVIQGFSGLMAATGSTTEHPIRVGPAVLDYGTGAQAAFAIASALYQRTRTGRGQRIDVAMADAALMLMSTHVVDAQITGRTPVPFGNQDPKKAGYSLYETAEGQLALGAVTVKQHADMWRVVGRDELAHEVGQLSRKNMYLLRDEHQRLLAELLLTEDADHWERVMNAGGVPAARVRRVDEAINHPQISTRGVLGDSEVDPDSGETLRMPVAAFGFEHGGPSHRRAAPRLGEHSREVLLEAGFGDDEIETLINEHAVQIDVA